MLVIPFAASFLAGAILSLVIPAGLLVAVGLWHLRAILRVEQGAGATLDSGPASHRQDQTPQGTEAADPASAVAAKPASGTH